VIGVVPEGGSLEAFDVVVANSDIVRTLDGMIDDPAAQEYLRQHEKQLAPSCSGIVLYLVHTPYLTSTFDWEQETARYRDLIPDKLERSSLTGLRESIAVSRIVTPRDLERM
jgi:hypothetical protein